MEIKAKPLPHRFCHSKQAKILDAFFVFHEYFAPDKWEKITGSPKNEFDVNETQIDDLFLIERDRLVGLSMQGICVGHRGEFRQATSN